MTTDSSFMSGDEHVDDDVRDDDYRVHTDICNQADYYQKNRGQISTLPMCWIICPMTSMK